MENIFVDCEDQARVVEAIQSYRCTEEEREFAPEWDLHPRFPATILVSPVRSEIEEGPDFPRHWPTIISDGGAKLNWRWIQLVSLDDCAELGLARRISRELKSGAIAIFAYDGADTYGYRIYMNGELIDDFHREMEERADMRANNWLEMSGIPYSLERYSNCNGPGWSPVTIDPLQ